MPYTVITENDESQWQDKTGAVYHFPKMYQSLLEPGTQVIYYKGKLKDKKYQASRLSDAPHYFGAARIGKVFPDGDSEKGDLFALIEDYQRFDSAVLTRIDEGKYLETIPESKLKNYWRSGVRGISQSDYEHILSASNHSLKEPNSILETPTLGEFESLEEGKKGYRYVTTYERNPKLRMQAIAIHGVTCYGCGFNFGKQYGPMAEGFIHIHHINPLSEGEGTQYVDPEKDLIPLCPNCHAVVHINKIKTLSLLELKALVTNTRHSQ